MLLLLFAGFGSSGAPPAPVAKKVGWIDDRSKVTVTQLNKILAQRTTWRVEVNRAYKPIQDNIDQIEAMTPLELAQEELEWLIAKRNNLTDRREIERLGRRINELRTEIYRLQLIAELKQTKH